MRDLLGGKGANVAEMTRVLGADRVPAGFTITTEACVAYMNAGQEEPDGMAEQVADGAQAPAGAHRQEPRRRRRPAAGLRPLRRARVDARDARHRPEPRHERQVGRGPRQGDRERPLRLGLLPALRADVRQRRPRASTARRSRRRSPRSRTTAASRRTPSSTRTRSRSSSTASRRSTRNTPTRTSRRTRRSSSSTRSAPSSTPGPATARSPTASINRIPDDWGTAVNVQQMVFGNKGDTSGSGVAFSPRRGDRRARAQRRLPPQRPGRGRRLRRAHAARHRRDEGLAARHLRAADGDPQDAREALRGHAGHRVHGGGGAALHAPDAQRQAAGAGRGALRARRRRRGAARAATTR